MGVEVHGLDAMEGETAFAFLVVRLHQVVDRHGLLRVLRYIAPLIPDADTFIDELPGELDDVMRVIGVPWSPPEAGHAVEAQRRLIEGAGAVGVQAAWFFQTGTSLPTPDGDDAGDEDDADDDPYEDDAEVSTATTHRAATRDDSWLDPSWSVGESTDTKTTSIELGAVSGTIGGDADEELDDADELDDGDPAPAGDADEDDDEDEGVWSHGAPPQALRVRFPVDGYPSIIDDLDWEDFGIAVKLAGPAVPGESTVLLGFHTLWLAPYGGRYRNAAVTFDRVRHAAHLWVDRFAVPCVPALLVHHLLWIVTKLDEIVPVVHARFGGATMAQKYGGLVGDTAEPFVLGGNPLIAVHAKRGEAGVDEWIATQDVWTKEEVAHMLRELAIEIVAQSEAERADEDAAHARAHALGLPHTHDDDDDDDGELGTRRNPVVVDEDEDDSDDDDDEDDDEDEDDDDDDDDDEADGNEDEDRGRQIANHAGELLRERARAGTLDPRAAEHLLPVLAHPQKYEHRRRSVVQILGALRHRDAVPALIKILDDTPIASARDSIGKEDFIAATAAALGAIGDPQAIPALSRVVAAPGGFNDKPRPVAADALASCLAATPEPRSVDDAVLAELLVTICERNDGELNAESHFAYGRIASQLPADRRAEARRRLEQADSARDDATALLARQAALVLASPTPDVDAPPRDLGPLLHEALTSLDYDHDYTVRNLRIALRVAEVVPELVVAEDLVWLTRFAEPDIRERAHALLVRRGRPLAPARVIDRGAAASLPDDELVRLIGEPHVVGRAALIAEAGRRGVRADRAIVDACHDVISRARPGSTNLLDPDTHVLEEAVAVLRSSVLAADTIALFERMLRHSNVHVKWQLLQAPPRDPRLVNGMLHVASERWGWQDKTARAWLAEMGQPIGDLPDATDDGELEDEAEHLDDQDIN